VNAAEILAVGPGSFKLAVDQIPLWANDRDPEQGITCICLCKERLHRKDGSCRNVKLFSFDNGKKISEIPCNCPGFFPSNPGRASNEA